MKKVLIPLGITAIALSIVAYAAAISGAQTQGEQTNAEKQLLVDGDMEVPAIIVPNSLVDSDMENSGTSDWVGVSSAVLSKTTSTPHGGAQVLHIVEDTGQGSARPAVTPVTSGKTYLIEGYARSDGTRQVLISQSAIGDVWQGNTDTDWQFFSVTYDSTTGLIYFGINTSGAPGGYGEFDDITVVEIIDTGTGDWNVFQAVMSKQAGASEDGSQVMRVAHDGSNSSGFVYQTIMTVGKQYRITGWTRSNGTGRPLVRDGLAGFSWTGAVSTDWQRIDFIGVPAHARLDLYGELLTGGHYVEYDDIFITEYVGDQTNAEKQILADGDAEASSTNAWTAASGAVLTKEAGAVKEGEQVLRITDTDWAQAKQYIITIGKTYKMTGWLRTTGAGCTIRVGEVISQTIYSGDWTYVETKGVATANYVRIRLNGNGWCEADDIFITEYVGEHTSSKTTAVPLASFTTTTGAWINSTDGNNRKWLEVVTAGLKSIESDQAYGTWIWRFNKQDASQMVNVPIASVNANWNNGSQDGYVFHIATTEMIRIFRVDSGSNESVLMQSSAGLFTPGVDYRIAITRDSSGEFTMYIKGGTEFPVWTLADSDAAGTNPATDNTYTSSNYSMIDGDAGDKLSEIQMYPNQVFTLAELQDHF